MSKLTIALKKVLGPSISGGGRGERWYWLTDESGEYSRGQAENDIAYRSLISNYECWRLTRVKVYPNTVSKTKIEHTFVDYIFIVTGNLGQFIGTCQLPATIHPDCIVMVHYTDMFNTEEELHNYNKAMDGMVSYERL